MKFWHLALQGNCIQKAEEGRGVKPGAFQKQQALH